MNITVCVDGKQFSHKTEGGKLLSALRGLGYSVNAACGGNSKCGKCRVDVEHNGVRKSVLSCEVFTEDGMTVFLPNDSIVDSKSNKPVAQKNGRYGFAVDVGTTTVVVYLVSLTAGEAVLTKSFLNPQRSYGADVVSRIEYCIKNGAEDLCQAITKSVGGAMEQMLFESGVNNVEEVVITGNTAMLNLFASEDVSSLGSYPFTPVFLTKKRVFNKYLPRCGALLLPGFSSFVGADIVCDGLAARVDNGCNLIVDLGTNGEILLSHKGKLYVTSVAAGPAFEGANIECGTGGIVGAISSVLPEDGGFKIGVIGGGEPIGICGSGLVDAIAVMLKLNVIDETGAFASDDRRFYLAEKVYLTDKDIRNFQLAKSAVRSGIESILDRCGLTFADVDNLYICGGLGYYINMSSAVATGLIPKELESKTVNFGNGAGEGAKMCLISSEELDRAEKMAASAEVVELASNPFFTEKFMENMFF